MGGPGDRKSLGKASAVLPATTKTVSKKSPEEEPLGKMTETVSDLSIPMEAEPKLKDVLCAVNFCKGSLSNLCDQLKGLKEELFLINQDLQRTVVKTTTLEERLSQVEDDLNPMKQQFKAMQAQIGLYKAKMDEIENRSRRNNVRVVGLPKRCEGSHPAEFLKKWLKGTFVTETFSHLFAIERAHRVHSRVLPPGGHSRPLIIKMLNYKDKVTLMQKARELGDIFHNGARISLYPDYSPDYSPSLQKRRAEFIDIKRSLWNYKIAYALLYPARLRITALGATHFF